MVYINAVKGSGIAFVVFIFISLSFHGYGESKEVELTLTISTFLFAIIAGFYISRMNTRYDRIKEFVSTEDALWLSLYENSKFYGSKFAGRIANLIDKYYIITYDFPDSNLYYKYSSKYFLGVYEELRKEMKRIRGKSEEPLATMLDNLSSIEENRNQTSVSLLERLALEQWMVLVALGGTVIFSVHYLKSVDMFSQITTVLLSSVLVLVILLTRDLQNLKLGKEWMLIESGQEVLEFMGKLRYYPERHLKSGSMRVPPEVRKYRIGLHKPGDKFRFKIVSK